MLSPDGTEWWHAYHAKIVRERNFKRVLQVQPMTWSAEGEPVLGGRSPQARRSVCRRARPGSLGRDAAGWDFASGTDGLADFDYYGHKQYVALEPDGLHLGRVPAKPVNAYRSAEKVVLRDGDYTDVRVTARLQGRAGIRAVGILFRVTGPSVGVDSQRGYFAAWVPKTGRLVLRRSNGRTSTELGSVAVPTPPTAGPSSSWRLSGRP